MTASYRNQSKSVPTFRKTRCEFRLRNSRHLRPSSLDSSTIVDSLHVLPPSPLFSPGARPSIKIVSFLVSHRHTKVLLESPNLLYISNFWTKLGLTDNRASHFSLHFLSFRSRLYETISPAINQHREIISLTLRSDMSFSLRINTVTNHVLPTSSRHVSCITKSV